MSSRFRWVVMVSALIPAVACGQQSGSSPTSPTLFSGSQASHGSQPASGTQPASGCGSTRTEQLIGTSINGVTPSGVATADMTQFACGGSTSLKVQVKNVNLPDGSVLSVTIDFTPVGNIMVSQRQGTLTADLGRFGVSNDQVRVKNGTTTILMGASFR